ncbi:MAG: hypothetical protein AAGK66_04435 [Pseudomonadota bacterium]
MKLFIILVAMFATACSTSSYKFTGPKQTNNLYPIDNIDLVTLIDPSMSAPEDSSDGIFGFGAGEEDAAKAARLDEAIINFTNNRDGDTPLLRNTIQDRYLAAVEKRCQHWKNFVYDENAKITFRLGGASTALAGLSTVFTDIETIRSLAAASGIAGGLRSEYSSTYLQTLTLQVILQGVDARRKRIRTEIYEARSDDGDPVDLEQYTLSQALYDVVRYHDSCSLYAGLIEASEAVEETQDLGVDKAIEILLKLTDEEQAVIEYLGQ